MSGRVLTALGGPNVAERHVQRFREHDEQLLRDQYLVYDDEAAVIQTSRDARNDLMHLFEADAESDDSRRADQRSAPTQSGGSGSRSTPCVELSVPGKVRDYRSLSRCRAGTAPSRKHPARAVRTRRPRR
jgi:hypothetical protein